MFIFDITNPLTLILVLIMTILLIFLAQELKKSYIVAIPLFVFLIALITHIVQLVTLNTGVVNVVSLLYRCIAIDFIFILITFFGYLWTDDIEAKATGKKSIDNSLEWFWKKV